MGSIVTKLDSNNKVVKVEQQGPPAQDAKTKISEDVLNKYKDNLNTNGAIIVSLRFLELIELIKKYYDIAKTSLKPEEIQTLPNPDNISLGLIFASALSQYGLFTMIEQNIKQNEKPEFVKVIVPMSLLKNDTEFINFVFTNFAGKLQGDKDPNMVTQLKEVFVTLIKALNSNSTKPEVRLANILNLSVHLGIIYTISLYAKSKKISEEPAIFTGLMSPLISSFPDNACYFAKDNLLSFTPDVCQVKKDSCPPCTDITSSITANQSCPEVACPSNENSTFKYLSIGLGILALIFFILYLTKKTVVNEELDSE
jgi:hypothetical protein